MNILTEKGYISEMSCGTNFAYILNNNSLFLTTEYKVLQSQVNSSFVKCMKMYYNGQIQLYYITHALKPLSAMLHGMDSQSFLTVASNLFTNIIDVKHNGFLSCQNIDISLEHIFVEPTTYKVHLVYLPTGERLFPDTASFENELRTSLVKLVSALPNLSATNTLQFSVDLSNGMLSLENLAVKLKDGKFNQRYAENVGTKTIRIVALNAPVRVALLINKDAFVIGKSPAADGVIGFNQMISRVHCRINRSSDSITITDLQSANGTFVNRIRLQANQPYPLKDGDVIRLANSDFKVNIA